jgi:RNA polymerase sigma-70 factor (ECF subfamily)
MAAIALHPIARRGKAGRLTVKEKETVFEVMNSPLCDLALVTAVKAGNREAFDELARRHRQLCLGAACSVTGNWADAEDVVQNALWKAYRGLGQLENQANFRQWLQRIVTNEALMKLRGRRRARWEDLNDNIVMESNGRSPEATVIRREERDVLRRAVKGLPVLLREPVRLHELEQLPLTEVARRLGTTVAAAKSRLHRGRRELKYRIESQAA